MQILRVALATFAPSIALVVAVLTRVERRLPVVLSFAAGYFAAIPALLLESALRTDHPIVRAFVVVALIEESTKMMIIAVAVWRDPQPTDRDDTVDLVPYGISAGMGIAVFENILVADVSAILLRSLTALPLHLSTGLVMAMMLQKHRTAGRMLGALAAAVFIHGLYDLPLFVSPNNRWIIVPFAFLLVVFCATRLIIWFRNTPPTKERGKIEY